MQFSFLWVLFIPSLCYETLSTKDKFNTSELCSILCQKMFCGNIRLEVDEKKTGTAEDIQMLWD